MSTIVLTLLAGPALAITCAEILNLRDAGVPTAIAEPVVGTAYIGVEDSLVPCLRDGGAPREIIALVSRRQKLARERLRELPPVARAAVLLAATDPIAGAQALHVELDQVGPANGYEFARGRSRGRELDLQVALADALRRSGQRVCAGAWARRALEQASTPEARRDASSIAGASMLEGAAVPGYQEAVVAREREALEALDASWSPSLLQDCAAQLDGWR